MHRKQPAQSWEGVSNRQMTSSAANTISLSHCGPLERTPVSAASHTPVFVPVLFSKIQARPVTNSGAVAAGPAELRSPGG